MDLKILASSFSLILLAELGDKTQLGVLSLSAQTRSPWSVFAGAALALIVSTAVAVVLGEAVNRVIPQAALRYVSGALFIVAGGWIILGKG